MIGIDLGTTNSLVAVSDDQGIRVLPNALGDDLTPSAIALAEDGSMLVGRAAKDRLVAKPDAGRAFFKRDMGTDVTYEIGDRRFSPTECSALVLQDLRQSAEAALGHQVTKAVISVPAYFNDSQRQATMEAAHIAGLEVDRLINEPTAAALAFGYHNPDSERQLLIFDLGGGTFDVTILNVFDGVIDVCASGGISRLGGEDYTEALMAHLSATHFIEIGDSLRVRIRQQVEAIKRRLGQHEQVEGRFADRDLTVTRDDFSAATAGLTARLKPVIQRALNDAGITSDELDDILLVGGASRMPVIHAFLADICQAAHNDQTDPDRAVAIGAAVQAALIDQQESVSDLVLTDVAPHSLGIESAKVLGPGMVKPGYFDVIIDRNTTLPVSREMPFQTIHPGQDELNIQVFQGEGRRTAENTKLGALHMKGLNVEGPLGGKVSVRFSYDMNGLLEVEVTRLHDQHTMRTVIEERPGAMSPKQIEEAIARLAPLKIHQRDLLVNQARLARATRLFEDLQGPMRAELEVRLDAFEAAIEQQDQQQVKITGAALDQFLEHFYRDEDEQPPAGA